jgi:hypothetical protein
MTVSSTTARVSYSGNGTTTVFPVPFYFLASSDLLVVLRSSAGIETQQVLSTNYTVTGAGVLSGGSVTMTVAPPSGTSLTILRNVALTQTTDFLPNDRLPAESLEQTVDKLTMIVQQLDDSSDRSIKFPITDSPSISAVLPSSSSRAGKFLKFSSTGSPTAEAVPTFAVSVTDFGATGDGTTDDTAAIQTAVNTAYMLFFPAGTYKVTSPITLRSNNHLFGEGASSVISYTGTATSQGALYANSGSASTYVENLVVRDLKVLGDVVASGFSEFVHLISFHGVRNCLIDNCEVVGFRGDGIIFGSGLNDNPAPNSLTERHNVDVTVKNCYIDGVNNDNRNGVSVIDGNGVTIENNYFIRCSRSTMPGAIDIEPDAGVFYSRTGDLSAGSAVVTNTNTTGLLAGMSVLSPNIPFGVTIASIDSPTQFTLSSGAGVSAGTGVAISAGYFSNFHVIRDISIRNNHIFDCRGGVAPITIFLPIQTWTTPASGFLIEGNYIDTPNAPGNQTSGILCELGNPFAVPIPIPPITEATPNLGIRILNNYIKFPNAGPGRGIVVWNVNDTIIDGNEFVGGSVSIIGWPNTAVYDLALTNNSFRNVNGTGDYAVTVNGGERLTFEGNTFIDCGATSGAARGAIEFAGNEMLANNTFASGASWITGTGWSIGAGVATKSPGTESSLAQTLTIPTAASVTYKLTYTITRSAGTITPRFTGGTTVTGASRNASGTYTEYLTAVSGTVTFELLADAAFDGTVDNVYLVRGWSRYVDIANNTFASPGGTFTQQAVRDSGHGFDAATNRFIGNSLLAGSNQFLADITLNNNPVALNNNIPNLGIGANPTTYALTVDTGGVPAASFKSTTGGPQAIATDGTVTQIVGYAATTYAFNGATSNHPWALLTNNTPRIEVSAAAGNVLFNTGNVGIGHGPNVWSASSKALQIGSWASLATDASNRPVWVNNAFLNASNVYEYINNGPALRVRLFPDTAGGNLTSQFEVATAANGTAGGTASFTTRFFVDADGRACLNNNNVTDAWAKWRFGGNIPTSSNQSVVSDARYTIPSGTTNFCLGYQSFASTEAASFTLTTLKHYSAEQGTIGAGSAVTTQIGYFADGSLTGATNNYGFYGAIAAAANRWNFYAAGTARNYFAGRTDVGNTRISESNVWNGVSIDSTSTVTLTSGSSVNLSSAICGGAIVSVYVTGSGNGGLFWANYSATVTKLVGNGEATDTGSDFAVYKNAASHTTTLKNKSASTQTFAVSILSGTLS